MMRRWMMMEGGDNDGGGNEGGGEKEVCTVRYVSHK